MQAETNFMMQFLIESGLPSFQAATDYADYYAGIYFVGVYFFATALMFILHHLRGQITLAPMLAFAGLLTFLVWQLVQLGWWVDWQDYKINAAILGVIPALLVGSVICYAMDGVRAARAYAGVILCGALLGMAYSAFIETLGRITPVPSLFFTPLIGQIALAVSILLAGFVAAIAAEFGKRLSWWLMMPLGFTAGYAAFLPLLSFLTYGLSQGIANINMEMPEYLLMASPAILTLLTYNLMAQRQNALMPKGRIFGIFSSPLSSVNQKHESIIAAREQISELQQLNQALQQEESLRYHHMQHSPLAMLELDRSGRLRRFNPKAQEMLAQNLTGKFFIEGAAISDYIPELKQVLDVDDPANNRLLKHVLSLPSADGEMLIELTIMPLSLNKAIYGYSILAEDITEREALARRTILSERVRGIHKTSQVIHHDFSNLMLAIQGHLNAIRQKLNSGNGAELLDAVNAIDAASQRGRSMLGQLGAGQVFHKPELKSTILANLLAEAVRIIEPQAKSQKIDIETNIDNTISVEVDGTQMLRVFINLLSNSIRAMQKGGSIKIESRLESRGVAINFTDTGIGMTPEQLQNVFDPGFSTKGQGQGGLGLAISYLITEAHGGTLSLQSENNVGTIARIWLPFLQTNENNNYEFKTKYLTPFANESVLLLLSQNDIRSRLASALQSLGCEVAELESHHELQAVLEENPDTWTVLIRSKHDILPAHLWHACRGLCDVVIDPSGESPMRMRPSSKTMFSTEDFERLLQAA